MPSICLLGILSIALAAIASPLVPHEQRRSAPSPPGFTSQGPAADGHTITLRFALASNNLPGLPEKLLDVSTPGSANFRQWLSQDEVKSFVEPSTDAVNAFNAFTSANGLKSSVISPYGEWVSVSLPVSKLKANQLFGAKFTNFTHTDLPAPIIRTLSVSLPSALAGFVQVVHPTTAFTTPTARLGHSIRFNIPNRKRDATAPADCDTSDPNNSITPACLQALYNIPSTPATQQSNALLVTGYEDEWAEIDDLQAFMKQFRPDLASGANQTFLRLAIDGGTNPQFPNSAATE
ncbi:Pro-kumamolisin, activation domain-containing protein [Mycena galopus ATCC 62051]|nr:Pro-kumamolisin, activation domain-containing protein [Mycena galopus ATCC 62051]